MSNARTAFELRREGRLPEALALARRLVAADCGNVWNRRALAWCLLSHGWNVIQARRANLAADWFQELTGLDLAGEAKLEASRAKLADAMQDVATRPIVQELKTLADATRENDAEAAGRPADYGRHALDLLAAYARLPGIRRPSLTHSLVLRYALRLAPELPGFLNFVRWWDSNFLRPDDFERFQAAGMERPAPSLCECLFTALHKARKREPDFAEHLDWMVPLFDQHARRFADNPYVAYHHGLMLADAGRPVEARAALVPFVRSRISEYWAWEALARACANEPALAAGCLCQALNLPIPGPEYLLKVRQQLAVLWLKLDQPGSARLEYDAVIALRRERGWPIPPQIAGLSVESQSPMAADEARALYAGHAARACQMVTPLDTPGVVMHINSEKGIVAIAVGPGREALARMDRIPAARGLKLGDVLALNISPGPAGRAAHVAALA
nr:hypothetical protein [Gammaproteobacteria bacterium]